MNMIRSAIALDRITIKKYSCSRAGCSHCAIEMIKRDPELLVRSLDRVGWVLLRAT